jgi:hypothetical protein
VRSITFSFYDDEVGPLADAVNETRNAVTDVLVRQKDPKKVDKYTKALVALGRVAAAVSKAVEP